MSLSSLLKNPEAREKFRNEFPRPPGPQRKEPVARPQSNHYGLVGTAFDYLLRFQLKRLNPKAITFNWVAESAVEKLAYSKRLHTKAQQIITDANEKYTRFLKSGRIDKSFLKSIILLAQLDPIGRSGSAEYEIGAIDDADLKDLKTLISLVDPKLFKPNKLMVLNPTFNRASSMVGGADADVLIDHTLVEIKTLKELRLRRDDFNQLIGYYILATIGGISGVSRRHRIDTLGVYFSRHTEFYKFRIKDVVNPKRFRSVVRWLRDRAGEFETDGTFYSLPPNFT